jgi:hypothetical protein
MTTPQADPAEPGDQEPAEGSRATVDAALADAEDQPTPMEEAERGVSDHVPDA